MFNNHSRRKFLKLTGIGICSASITPAISQVTNYRNSPLSDTESESISLNIVDYDAVGDGITMNTSYIQKAIDRCWLFGGGEVVVPSGNFLSGAIALRSNVILRFEKGAILTGSANLNDYEKMQVRWEGKWIEGYSALIYAIDCENIAITGPGKIMGSHEVGGRPSKEDPLRRPSLVEFIGCSKIKLEDFHADYHLMWCIHPTYCRDIFIKDITIRTTGGNGDGIDIDSCKRVKIDHCDMITGDDCIAIKSGRGMEGNTLMQTTEDVEITNCSFTDTIFACIGIGSECSGGVRNVSIRNCNFNGAKTSAIYVKSRVGRGAFIENITAENIKVKNMERAFLRLNLTESGIRDPYPVPEIDGITTTRNFTFKNIEVENVPVLVEGVNVHPQKPMQRLTLENISGTCNKGIFLANIKNLRISNIEVSGYEGQLISINNVTGTGIEHAIEIETKEYESPISDFKPYVLK